MSESQNQSILQICEELFRDFQFGLNLIRKNTGQDTFVITAEAVENPDKYLSGLVVASYRSEDDAEMPSSDEPEQNPV